MAVACALKRFDNSSSDMFFAGLATDNKFKHHRSNFQSHGTAVFHKSMTDCPHAIWCLITIKHAMVCPLPLITPVVQ